MKRGANMPKVDRKDMQSYGTQVPAAGEYTGWAISGAAGLTALGANIEVLMPGATSSKRHWHDKTDELVIVLKGQLVLVEDGGETVLHAGDVAAFPARVPNGHCLENKSDLTAEFLVVGSRDADDTCYYADVDMVRHPDGSMSRKDGSPLDDGHDT